MIKEHQLIAIFSEIDDFCKELDKNMAQLSSISPTKGKRGPTCCLAISEIMTIQILFQMLGYRNFKTFYTGFLQNYWKAFFPLLPSYSRFIELIQRAIFPLTLTSTRHKRVDFLNVYKQCQIMFVRPKHISHQPR